MRLIETIDFSGAQFVEESGVRIIKNVSLLGLQSSHGYRYLESAAREAVKNGLYEGTRCYLGHKEGARDLRDLCGVFKNARFEGAKVKGDAHLLQTESGNLFWSIAKDAPKAAACSHVASGKVVQRGGERVVESIDKVLAVDLVPDGATNAGLFEGKTLEEGVPKPGAKERQVEFYARCVAQVKSNNNSIADDEAVAICMTAWGSRYEPGGTDESFVAPVKPAEQTPADTHTQQTGDERSPERNSSRMSTKEQLHQELAEYDAKVEQVASLGDRDPGKHQIIRDSLREEQDEDYRRRCEQAKHDRARIQEIANATDPDYRESDSEFSFRCAERRQLQEKTERDAAQIAEKVLPPAGGLVE